MILAAPEAVNTSTIVISLRVRVPVLSVQITVADPSVSTDESRFTIARLLAIRCTPSARTTDRIAGSPSGTAATASETPINRASTVESNERVSAVRITAATIMADSTTTATPSHRPSQAIWRCRGVWSSPWSSIVAIRPI